MSTFVSVYCNGTGGALHDEWFLHTVERQWAPEIGDAGAWIWVDLGHYRRPGSRGRGHVRLARSAVQWLDGDRHVSRGEVEASPELLATIRGHYNFQCRRCPLALAKRAEDVHPAFDTLTAAGLDAVNLAGLRAIVLSSRM